MLKSWTRIEFIKSVVAGFISKQAVPYASISSKKLEGEGGEWEYQTKHKHINI